VLDNEPADAVDEAKETAETDQAAGDDEGAAELSSSKRESGAAPATSATAMNDEEMDEDVEPASEIEKLEATTESTQVLSRVTSDTTIASVFYCILALMPNRRSSGYFQNKQCSGDASLFSMVIVSDAICAVHISKAAVYKIE